MPRIPRPVNEWYSAHRAQDTQVRFQALEGRTITSPEDATGALGVSGRWDIAAYKASSVLLAEADWADLFLNVLAQPDFRDLDTVYFPAGSYELAGAGLVVTRPVRITGNYSILTSAIQTKLIDVQTNDVSITYMTLQGLTASTYSSSSFGVYARGASASGYLQNLNVSNCRFYDISGNAIQTEFVNYIVVRDNHYQRYARGANMFLSSSYGTVENNLIEDAMNGTGNPSNNTYPVAISRNTTLGIAAQPRSTNWTVRNNIVRNNPWWEGIDTHGGDTIVIEGNFLYNVDQPIAVVSSADVGSSASVFAPQNVIVRNNYMNSMRTDGAAKIGIVIDGAGTTAGGMIGNPVELAAGCIVEGNIVIGHGRQNTSTNAGISATWTQGLIIRGNFIDQCSVHGIAMQNDNYNFIISDNVIRDAWSNSLTNPSCMTFATFYCTGIVTGNMRAVGEKTATFVGVRGITVTSSRVPATHNNDIVLGINHWGPEPVDEINSVVSLWSGGSLKFGFGNQRQNMTDLEGALAGGASLADVITEVNRLKTVLTNLGISFNTT